MTVRDPVATSVAATSPTGSICPVLAKNVIHESLAALPVVMEDGVRERVHTGTAGSTLNCKALLLVVSLTTLSGYDPGDALRGTKKVSFVPALFTVELLVKEPMEMRLTVVVEKCVPVIVTDLRGDAETGEILEIITVAAEALAVKAKKPSRSVITNPVVCCCVCAMPASISYVRGG